MDLFSEHSYPPINFVSFGRCNFPKYPVFYCSNNPMTALMEVVRENNYKDKKYCISKWEIIQSEDKLAFQTFLQTDLHSENDFNLLKKVETEQLNEPFKNKLDKERINGIIELLKFLQSTFIKDKDYSISASLAHRTLYAKHNFATDILLYPSIQTKYKGVNMAIHPNFVDNNLRLKRLYIVQLENIDINSGKFETTFSKYATIDKNVLMWKNLKDDNNEYKKILLEDFGSMMLPDFEWKFNPIKK
ncbi:MAG: RES domain-containing protein [Lutibacter sp.]